MKLDDCKITFLFEHEGATIEFHDGNSHITFLRVRLTDRQVCTMFSRLGHTPVESAEVFGFEKLNKKMLIKPFEFEIPSTLTWSRDRDLLRNIAKKKCPKGWEIDLYFDTSNTFFSKGKKTFARTHLRKWVDSKKRKNR